MARQKGPKTAEELAAHLKQAGGVHLHRFRYTYIWSWKLAYHNTRKCGTPDCFVMRVKNVRETETPQA